MQSWGMIRKTALNFHLLLTCFLSCETNLPLGNYPCLGISYHLLHCSDQKLAPSCFDHMFHSWMLLFQQKCKIWVLRRFFLLYGILRILQHHCIHFLRIQLSLRCFGLIRKQMHIDFFLKVWLLLNTPVYFHLCRTRQWCELTKNLFLGHSFHWSISLQICWYWKLVQVRLMFDMICFGHLEAVWRF